MGEVQASSRGPSRSTREDGRWFASSLSLLALLGAEHSLCSTTQRYISLRRPAALRSLLRIQRTRFVAYSLTQRVRCSGSWTPIQVTQQCYLAVALRQPGRLVLGGIRGCSARRRLEFRRWLWWAQLSPYASSPSATRWFCRPATPLHVVKVHAGKAGSAELSGVILGGSLVVSSAASRNVSQSVSNPFAFYSLTKAYHARLQSITTD